MKKDYLDRIKIWEKGDYLELYVKETGSEHQSCMLFLHGSGASSWMWEDQVQYFQESYHCIVIDLPEQGNSKESEPFTIRTTAIWINRYIEEIAKEKELIVVGFELGAQIAIKMMSMRPNLFDYAILSSASVRVSEFKKNRLLRYIPLIFPYLKKDFILKRQAKSHHISESYLQIFYDEKKQLKLETHERLIKENISFEMPEYFHLSKAQILVVVGLRERGIVKRSTIDLVTKHPNATGVFIPQVGKGLSLVEPHYFNRMIESWLRDESLPKDALPFK